MFLDSSLELSKNILEMVEGVGWEVVLVTRILTSQVLQIFLKEFHDTSLDISMILYLSSLIKQILFLHIRGTNKNQYKVCFCFH